MVLSQCHLSPNFIRGMAHLILGCLGSGLPHLQGPCPSPVPGAATLKALYLGKTSFSATLQELLVHPTCSWHGHRLPVHRVTTILSIYGVVTFQYSFFSRSLHVYPLVIKFWGHLGRPSPGEIRLACSLSLGLGSGAQLEGIPQGRVVRPVH